MNANARRRIEAAKRQLEQAARDAAYLEACERDGLTPEQLRERHSETLIEAVRREAAEADSE